MGKCQVPACWHAKCHMLQVETGLSWVPNVITMINHSPGDQQRDLSLFMSNETPQQEQLNTPETQGRHPIPGGMLAPVTKSRSQEGSQFLPYGKPACTGCVEFTWVVAGDHLQRGHPEQPQNKHRKKQTHWGQGTA